MTVFRLRFPTSDVQHWADRYSYADDSDVRAIGANAGRKGWYSRVEFLDVMFWKTKRTQTLCALNTEASVVKATSVALSADDERLRMRALTSLHGVAVPTASVLLHIAHRDPYPIVDFRALWSLGLDAEPRHYSFAFWWAYTQTCRALAAEAGVTMRTFDRALWQYSRERQRQSATMGGGIRNSLPSPVGPEFMMNKSAEMRRLYEQGQNVAQVARALGVAYGFAYGVRKRWLEARDA